MDIFRQLDEVPAAFEPSFVCVGNFDGVHRAHAAVLQEIVRRARAAGGKSVAVTFEPHPTRILRPDSGLKLLTPTPQKLRLLRQAGVDATLLLPFGRDMSLLTPREFAQQILHQRLHAREVHEGFNFRFGHKAVGDLSMLRGLGQELGFSVHEYSALRLRRETVSSSRIRELLRDGLVSRARYLLGRPFSMVELPGRGRGFGTRYTVPTINLSRYEELIPRDGVYITFTCVGSERFESVTNVGNRPTFGADSFAVESHLLNFHPIELTPETPVEIAFLDRVRDEIKFPSVDALKDQIARDVNKARRYFQLLGKVGIARPQ
jgi:riboflavin kinase/FMN adenylyltransferase